MLHRIAVPPRSTRRWRTSICGTSFHPLNARSP